MSAAKPPLLLTGATGFLGRSLLPMLLEEGYPVTAMVRPTSDLTLLAPWKESIQVITTSWLGDPNRLATLPRFKLLIHTAALYSSSDPSDLVEANIAFPLRVLERCAIDSCMNTATPLPPELSAYASTKHLFRQLCDVYCQEQGIQLTHLSVQQMFGPGDSPKRLPTHLIQSCLRDAKSIALTPGEQKRDFIFISDLIAAYKVLIDRVYSGEPLEPEYSVGSGKGLSLKDFALLIKQLTHSKTELRFGERPYRAHEPMELVATPSALGKLGWMARVTMEDALSKTIQFEKERGL